MLFETATQLSREAVIALSLPATKTQIFVARGLVKKAYDKAREGISARAESNRRSFGSSFDDHPSSFVPKVQAQTLEYIEHSEHLIGAYEAVFEASNMMSLLDLKVPSSIKAAEDAVDRAMTSADGLTRLKKEISSRDVQSKVIHSLFKETERLASKLFDAMNFDTSSLPRKLPHESIYKTFEYGKRIYLYYIQTLSVVDNLIDSHEFEQAQKLISWMVSNLKAPSTDSAIVAQLIGGLADLVFVSLQETQYTKKTVELEVTLNKFYTDTENYFKKCDQGLETLDASFGRKIIDYTRRSQERVNQVVESISDLSTPRWQFQSGSSEPQRLVDIQISLLSKISKVKRDLLRFASDTEKKLR